MSVEPFLKNIYFFVKILNQACSKDVADWDLNSWQNAFHWATYCEQLYQQVSHRSMKTDFEQCIQRLNSLNLPLVCGQLNLKFLKKAGSHLTQLLIQNPYLPEMLFEETISVCMKDRKSVIMQCVDQNWQTASLQVVDRLKRCLVDCTKNRTDGCINASREILPEIEAKFLWDRLLLAFRASQDCERLPIAVKKIVISLNKTETGWDILLHLLQQNQHNCANLLDKLPSQIHSVIEDHMCKSIMQSQVPSLIWRSNRAILNEILGQSFLLFSACLTQLIQWGNKFVPVYQYKHNFFYVWIYQPDKKFDEKSFEILTSYMRILVDSGPQQKAAVLATLRSLEAATLCCIWQDVLAAI